jgi:3-deoxy-7-phosphoheptulonate synthase
MVVIMQNAAPKDLDAVLARIAEFNLRGSVTVGESQNIVGIVGTPIPTQLREMLESMSGVRRSSTDFASIQTCYPWIPSRDTIVDVRSVLVGGGSAVVMAGQCAVESETQVHDGGSCHQKSWCPYVARWRLQTALVAL